MTRAILDFEWPSRRALHTCRRTILFCCPVRHHWLTIFSRSGSPTEARLPTPRPLNFVAVCCVTPFRIFRGRPGFFRELRGLLLLNRSTADSRFEDVPHFDRSIGVEWSSSTASSAVFLVINFPSLNISMKSSLGSILSCSTHTTPKLSKVIDTLSVKGSPLELNQPSILKSAMFLFELRCFHFHIRICFLIKVIRYFFNIALFKTCFF
mmetsp:Transcript_13489/g.26812  ORF Transcript_13489/g.26812 Transcript_13489/m.26812 type:complete len:209 (-) Transcript_13489:18-644(-)